MKVPNAKTSLTSIIYALPVIGSPVHALASMIGVGT